MIISREQITILNKNIKDKAIEIFGSVKGNNIQVTLLFSNNKQVYGRPMHLQTPGEIERYHRTMKNVGKLHCALRSTLSRRGSSQIGHYILTFMNRLKSREVYLFREREMKISKLFTFFIL